MPELIDIKESVSVPATKFEVFLIKDGFTHNVTEKLINKPNIVDSSDYQQNLTYLNEITLELNNDDGSIYNGSGTGLLNVDSDKVIECKVKASMDGYQGRDFGKFVFGGWLDCAKIKPDALKRTASVTAYSYFGKLERLSGLNLVTQYFDSNGLILYGTGLFIARANIAGKFLKNGKHTIYHKQEEGLIAGMAKLDDGDWTPVNYAELTILSNRDGSEQVEIGTVLTALESEGESRIVVKNQGDQYPYTYFFFGSAIDVVRKCFEVAGINSMQIDRFEIPTIDGRRVLSWMPNFSGQNFFGYPNSIVSNGTDRIFISITTTNLSGADLLYEIWEVNLTDNTFTKRYSVNNEWYDRDGRHQLEISEDGSRLYAYFRTNVSEAFVLKFNTATWDMTAYPINDDTYEWGQVHLIPSGTGGKVIFCGEHLPSGNKHVYVMNLSDTDDPGEVESVYHDNTIDTSAFQHLYYDGEDVWFYFCEKTGSTTWWLRRLKFNGGSSWTYEEIAGIPSGMHPGNVRGYSYVTKDKIAMLSYGDDVAHMIRHTAKTISGNICPEGWQLYSGWEEPEGADRKLYVIAQRNDASAEEKLSYIHEEEFHFDTNVPEGVDLLKGVDPVRKQIRFCSAVDNYGNKIMMLVSRYPGMLIRYANTFIPTIFGEYNTDGKTLRQVMQEIANNYLAFIRVDTNKKGFFIRRSDYITANQLKLKKKYIKGNVKETLYSQKYEYVIVNTRNSTASAGDKAIDNKGLEVRLDLIPDDYAVDFANWFYLYYQKERKQFMFQYLPTYFNHEVLDKVDLSELGLNGTARIQSISPTETDINLKVVYEEPTGIPTEE